jgi:DNA-binding NarL/FixJ family response regulator
VNAVVPRVIPGTTAACSDHIQSPAAHYAEDGIDVVHVVILTTFDLDEYVFEGLRAGAAGFLVKDTRAAELIRAVRVAASGRRSCPPPLPGASSPSSRCARGRRAAYPSWTS